MELVNDYKSNDSLRRSFNSLANQIFGISFEDWYQKGLWKDNYICHSYQDQGKIVANVSAAKMRARVNGREKELLQLGTVMVAEKYRGQGLAKELMEYVRQKYEEQYQSLYLFANNGVVDFYKNLGYQRVRQRQLFSRQILKAKTIYQFRKLDLNNSSDFEILLDIAENRLATSDELFFKANQGILYWYCLEVFKNNIYYCSKEDIIVIFELNKKTLNIYDIIFKYPADYKSIVQSVLAVKNSSIQEIIFHFNVDSEGLVLESRPLDDVKEDDFMFVKGEFKLQDAVYPIIAHI